MSTNDVTEDAFGTDSLAHVVQTTGQLATAADTDIHLGSETKDTITYSLATGASMAKGKYGTLFLESNGTYRYVLDNNNPTVQALSKDGTLTDEVFSVKAHDGSSSSVAATLSITVHGTNDAPTITLHQADGPAGSGASLYVTETEGHLTGTMPSVSGKAVAHDVDNGDTHTFSIDHNAVYAHMVGGAWVQSDDPHDTHIGDFSINSDGTYTFTMAQAAEALAHGDKVILTATVTTVDGGGASASAPVQVTVTGTNTTPVLNVLSPTTLTDDHSAAQHIDGYAVAKDADVNSNVEYYIKTATGSLVQELANDYGTLKIDNTGHYTFTLNDAGTTLLSSLGVGEHLSDALMSSFGFNIVAKDQYNASSVPQTLHIDLQGINDAPVFSSSAYTASVQESGVNNGNAHVAGTHSASGQVASTDLDVRDIPTYSIDGVDKLATSEYVDEQPYDYSKTTDYGTLYLNSGTGKYVFVLDERPNGIVDQMTSTQSKTLNFAIAVSDGKSGTASSVINVTIKGTNDAPVLTVPTALTVTEDTSTTASGTLAYTDVDTGGSHGYSIVTAAVGQSYVTNHDGSYTNGATHSYAPPRV